MACSTSPANVILFSAVTHTSVATERRVADVDALPEGATTTARFEFCTTSEVNRESCLRGATCGWDPVALTCPAWCRTMTVLVEGSLKASRSGQAWTSRPFQNVRSQVTKVARWMMSAARPGRFAMQREFGRCGDLRNQLRRAARAARTAVSSSLATGLPSSPGWIAGRWGARASTEQIHIVAAPRWQPPPNVAILDTNSLAKMGGSSRRRAPVPPIHQATSAPSARIRSLAQMVACA